MKHSLFIRITIVIVACLALFPARTAQASGVGPSDWAGMVDIIVVGPLSGISGGDKKVVSYFMQIDEVWRDTDKKVVDMPILEILTGNAPDENAAQMVSFLSHLEGNQFLEVAAISLPKEGVKLTQEALKEWVMMGLRSGHKVKKEYKELLLRNLQSGDPTLVRFATNELMYVTRMLSHKDGKAIESALFKTNDDYIRNKLCLRLIAMSDTAFLPTWVQVLGQSESPKAIISLLRQFRPKPDKPNPIHNRLDSEVQDVLHKFEILQTGGDAQKLKNAELATRGLNEANYALAIGELRLTGCIPSLQKRLDMKDVRLDTLQESLIGLGKLHAEELRPQIDRYCKDSRLSISGSAYTALAYWCDRQGEPGDEEKRLDALRILGGSEQADANGDMQFVTGLLLDNTKHKLLRQVALEGLAFYKPSEVNPILIRFFQEETDTELLLIALKTRMSSPKGDLLQAMVAMLDRPLEEKIHLKLITFFAERSTNSAIPGIWKVLENKENSLKLRELSFQAIRLLGKRKDRKRLNPFVKELKALRKEQSKTEK